MQNSYETKKRISTTELLLCGPYVINTTNFLAGAGWCMVSFSKQLACGTVERKPRCCMSPSARETKKPCPRLSQDVPPDNQFLLNSNQRITVRTLAQISGPHNLRERGSFFPKKTHIKNGIFENMVNSKFWKSERK